MSKHTPGPWKLKLNADGSLASVTAGHPRGRDWTVCKFLTPRRPDLHNLELNHGNMGRIVDCANACDGIENPALALEMARVALKAAQAYLRNTDAVKIRAIDDALAALEAK